MSLEASASPDFCFDVRPLGVSVAQLYSFLVQDFVFSTVECKQRSGQLYI